MRERKVGLGGEERSDSSTTIVVLKDLLTLLWRIPAASGSPTEALQFQRVNSPSDMHLRGL